jgi:carbon-monoxide dehydrogenase large subunit
MRTAWADLRLRDYAGALDKALGMIDYAGFATRKATPHPRQAAGIGSYVAVAGVGPSAKMGKEGLVSGTWGSAYIAVLPSGEITVTTGAQPHGQSQVTTFSQIVSQVLGVPSDAVAIHHSDTNGKLYYGQATYGSRSLSVEGVAVFLAAQKLRDKARALAAHLFKANVDDVLFGDGKAYLRFAPDKAVMTLQQVAFMLWLAWDLPEGMDPGLEATAYFNPLEFNYPFGTHVAEVEIDEQSGKIDVVRYVAVDDSGVVVNPRVVDGQRHGNIALGIGQALSRRRCSEPVVKCAPTRCQLRCRARPSRPSSWQTARCRTTDGREGRRRRQQPAGRPAIVNAVCDALSDSGVRDIPTPSPREGLACAAGAAPQRSPHDSVHSTRAGDLDGAGLLAATPEPAPSRVVRRCCRRSRTGQPPAVVVDISRLAPGRHRDDRLDAGPRPATRLGPPTAPAFRCRLTP